MSNNDETPIYYNLVNDSIIDSDSAIVTNDKKWYERILTPTFRKWAYGLAAAAVTTGFTLAGKPEWIPTIIPLIIAIFYVDNNGEPK